jgi:hypothetical protein
MKSESYHALASRVDHPQLQRELCDVCREALRGVIVDPAVRVLDISIESFFSLRFDLETEKLLIIVNVKTNDPSMLRGDTDRYKGSYKERVEGILEFYARRSFPDSEVYLEIDGPETSSVQRLIPVGDFLKSGRLAHSSPIVRVAQSFSMPYILVRGRHFIAPSPAIAQYLTKLANRPEIPAKTVLDLFGGTGIAAKILCKVGDPDRVVVVEKDPDAVRKMKEHILDPRVELTLADALTYPINESFDIAIADPYYEDVVKFLQRKLEAIFSHTKLLVLVPGNVGDTVWNAEVERILKSSGLRIGKFIAFGQVILEVSP